MAYQKKCYRSTDAKTNRHQLRGGGLVARKNHPHKYATRPVEAPISPTFLAARAVKKLKVLLS